MTADYLRIEPNEDWALASGDVELLHESAKLSAPSLMYLMNSRAARYSEGALIVDEGWTVKSRSGLYRTASETLELGGNVLAVNKGDTLRSDSLHWTRTESRYRFFGPTDWVGSDVRFTCQCGRCHHGRRSTPGLVGWRCQRTTTTRERCKVTAWRGAPPQARFGATWFSPNRMAREPCMADTPCDKTKTLLRWSLEMTNKELGWNKSTKETPSDWLPTPSNEEGEFLTAFHRVTLVQDELVGIGDSLVWMDDEGTIQMWGEPRLWSGEDKLSGDTLTLWLTDQSPDKLEMRGHAVVLSSANDTLAHRIQGRELDAFFEEGELRFVDVVGNGEVVTFDVPEGEGNVRMNTAVCAKVTLEVAERKLTGIALKQSPRGKIQPVPTGTDLAPFRVEKAPRSGPWETSEQGPLPE